MKKTDKALNTRTIKYSFKSSLPVMAGYIVIGIGFGVLLQSKGYGWWWAALMSVSIYAGSMQFVTVDLLTAGASIIATALMTLMVNVRHLFYGVSMVKKYKNTGRAKPYLIYALTDETFSLLCNPNIPEDVDEKKYYFYVSLFNQIYWIIGSILGAVLGSAIAFNSMGIDFAMTALFVVIFVEQWEKERNHIPALTGIIASIICLLIFGPSNFLIPAMLIITACLFVLRRWIKTNDGCIEEGEAADSTKGGEGR